MQAAEVLEESTCERMPSSLTAIQFHGVAKTKLDGLQKEVAHLYSSGNLDELVKNSHLAAIHMQVFSRRCYRAEILV